MYKRIKIKDILKGMIPRKKKILCPNCKFPIVVDLKSK